MAENKISSVTFIDLDVITSRCVTEVMPPSLNSWKQIKDDIMPFERLHFGEDFGEDELVGAFENPEAIIVVTRDQVTTKIVGFTYAEPVQKVYREDFHPERKQLPHTAYIQNTALSPDYIGHKLVGPMIERLEAELIAKGYLFIERDSIVSHGYADNIKKNYKDRIVLVAPHESRWGEQIFFRIKLTYP